MSALAAAERARLKRLPALERAQEANRLREDHLAAIGELASLRRAAVAELVAAGATQAEIGRQLGVSQAAIAKVLRERPT